MSTHISSAPSSALIGTSWLLSFGREIVRMREREREK